MKRSWVDVVNLKWVFKKKYSLDGSVVKQKARLVPESYDFKETFSPVTRYETLRMLLALSAYRNWPIYQLDVDVASVTGNLEEEVRAWPAEGMGADMYTLAGACYGMEQSPRGWYAKLASFLERKGFERSGNQPTLYVKKGRDDSLLLVCVYVFDVIYMGSSPSVTAEFKESMISRFKMTDLGKMHSFLGLEIKQCEGDGVFVSQRKYAEKLLKRFDMTNCNAVNVITPMSVDEKLEVEDGSGKADASIFKSLVSGLVCLTHTRPDIAFAVGVVSRFMDNPTALHFGAAKRILRYIAGTRDFGIWHSGVAEFKLVGFTDSDWEGSSVDRRSISGSVFNFGSGAVAWSSKKQGVAASSTTEAENMAANASACQAMWLRRVLADLDEKQEEATEIFSDNIAMTKNPFLQGRTEHMNIQFDYIRNLVNDGFISLKLCNSDEHVADIFTKPLLPEKHIRFRAKLGVCKLWIKC